MADRALADAAPSVSYLQHKVTLKVLEVQACCSLGSMRAAEKACRELHNACDRCEGAVDAHPLARAHLIWRQLRAECSSRQGKAADSLRMLQEALPFAEASSGGVDGPQIAALMVDCIICRLDLHMSGKQECLQGMQADMDRGLAALRTSQPPASAAAELHERWVAEGKVKTWLHVWRGLRAAEGDGLDIDAARKQLEAYADRWQPDRVDEPMAAWQAAGRVLAENESPLLRWLPWARRLGFNATSATFVAALLVPVAIGLWLILFSLGLV